MCAGWATGGARRTARPRRSIGRRADSIQIKLTGLHLLHSVVTSRYGNRRRRIIRMDHLIGFSGEPAGGMFSRLLIMGNRRGEERPVAIV